MKNLSIVFAVSSMFFGLAASAQQDFRPVLVNHNPENVFIPQDFDNNDNAQVVVDGTFGSTCYKTAPTEYVVDENKKVITVRNKAYFYNSSWCAFMMVPYYQTVNLGIISAGKYDVKTEDENGASKSAGQLPVFMSNSLNPDDYLYAPVNEAILSSKKGTEKRTVLLRGAFTSSCMSLKEVKVIYRGNVIEVLPVAQMAEGACLDRMIPFTKTITIEQDMKGKNLLHVRSLSGQSINNVVNFDI